MKADAPPNLIHKPATPERELVARVPGLRRRGNSWEYRKRVPDALRAAVGRKEHLKSFGDIPRRDAERLAELEAVRVRALFDAARAGGHRSSPLWRVDADNLAKRYLLALERQVGPVPLGPAQDNLKEELAEEGHHLGHPLAVEDAGLQLRVSSFAKSLGLDPESDRAAFYELCQRCLDAEVEHNWRQQARLGGEPVLTFNAGFADVGSNAQPGNDLTLSQGIDAFVSAPERRSLSPRTIAQTSCRLRVMQELLGPNKLVGTITRQEMRAYRDTLLELPLNAQQRFKGMSAAEAIEANKIEGKPTLSNKTANLYMEQASALFGWLEEEGMLPKNNARGLASLAVADSTRRPLKTDEINALLQVTSSDARGGKDWAYWSARIGLLHGTRITEPMGLKVKDVTRHQGVWSLRLEPNGFRNLKTDETKRWVPVHPKLIQLGILELIEGRHPEDLLLADVPRGDGKSFNAAQKQMGRIVRKVSTDPDAVYHSLRHNMRDVMLASEVPEAIAARLGGWKLRGSSSMNAYGSGHTMSHLLSWLQRLVYPGIVIH